MASIVVGMTCFAGIIATWLFKPGVQRPTLEQEYRLSSEIAVGNIYKDGRKIQALDYHGQFYLLQSTEREDTQLTYTFEHGHVLKIHYGYINRCYSLEHNRNLVALMNLNDQVNVIDSITSVLKGPPSMGELSPP